MVIGFSPSIWFDRQTNCPKCQLLVKVSDEECPHCGYLFTMQDRKNMESKVRRQYLYSATLGLVFFLAVMATVYLLASYAYGES